MRNWVVMVASLVAAAPATAATLTRGPYLQLLTETSVTVVWNTDVPAACSLAIHPMDGFTTVLSGGSGTVCAVSVDGLVPGAFYGYVPRANSIALRGETVFQTDDAKRSFSFLVVGDSGSGGDAQLAVRDRMVGTAPDFLLHTGDMIYDSGEAEKFDPLFFKPYEQLLRRAVFWPTLGNHDVRTDNGAPWRDAFYTPANNPLRSENYYSFNRGNAHVVVLDTNQSTSPSSAQYKWLEQDLAASQAPWKFVAFHHTIYSNGRHGSTLTIRNNLAPLFDRYGVDIVFMGHDHDYERTLPLRGDMVVAPGTGTTYVTTGGGGKELYDVGSSWFTAYSESAHHFTRVLVNGNLLFLQMIRADGVIRDRLMLSKGSTVTPPPPPPTTTTTRPALTTTTTQATPTTTTFPPFTLVTTTTTTTTTRAPTTTLPPLPPGAITMTPIADTYIEAGTEGTWDHGGCTHMDVDKRPAGLTYLKFDLSSVTQPIGRALLQLYVTNTSVDGGAVYPVPFSGWIEGTGNGVDATSADGPGLKWSDVDANGDGKLDSLDQNLLVPDPARSVVSLGPVTSTQTIRLDVTAAFRGPGIYTLAIMNGSTDGTTFSSREAPKVERRPLLALWTGTAPPPPPPPVSTTTTTTRPPTSSTSSTVPVPTTTRPPTTTTTTLRPPPPPPPPPPPGTAAFQCLSEPGPVMKATGTWADRWVQYSLAADTKIDARTFTALASPSNLYPVRIGGGDDLCLAGATVLGQYNRSWSWTQMHDLNNAGIVSKNKFATIDGVHVDNVEDGYRPENGPFTVRQAWFTYIRDDCVENDHVFGGLIEDSLFEECFVGISERPTDPIIADGFDGGNQLLTISHTLIGLTAMPGPRGGADSDMGHGILFKWGDHGTKLALHDNIFMAETASISPSSMGIPESDLVSCSNNVMVWLGPGNYPAKLPSCVTVTRDRSVWDRAVADWKARHPQVVQ